MKRGGKGQAVYDVATPRIWDSDILMQERRARQQEAEPGVPGPRRGTEKATAVLGDRCHLKCLETHLRSSKQTSLLIPSFFPLLFTTLRQ